VSLGACRPVIKTEGTNSGQPGRYQAALRAGYSCSAVALNLDRGRQRSGSMEHRDRGVVADRRLPPPLGYLAIATAMSHWLIVLGDELGVWSLANLAFGWRVSLGRSSSSGSAATSSEARLWVVRGR
jgi:hypothetical protein